MTNHAAEKKVRNLQKVLEISRSLAAADDLDSLLTLIIERSMELLDAERATLFLYEADTNELVSRIAAGVDEIRVPADRGISGATVKSGSTVNVPDVYADERFNPQVDRTTGFHTRSILSLPLWDYQGSLVGVLQAVNKRSGAFGPYDITLAETLAAQAGVAIQRARLIGHYIEKQQMERAMQIARDIQQGLLPDSAPQIDGFDIAGFSAPADATGGDTYDFLPLPDGRWMIIVADASGHGVGPALVIAETRAMLRAVCLQQPDISAVLQIVNRLLIADLDEARFVTCFFGLLDPPAGSMTYASAGHGPMIFYDRKADQFHQVAATTLPLGVMEEISFDRTISHKFSRGDLAVIITDGFFEAVDAAGRQFGVERMIERLRRDRDLPAAEIIANLHKAVTEFTGRAAQADDLTAIVIRKR